MRWARRAGRPRHGWLAWQARGWCSSNRLPGCSGTPSRPARMPGVPKVQDEAVGRKDEREEDVAQEPVQPRVEALVEGARVQRIVRHTRCVRACASPRRGVSSGRREGGGQRGQSLQPKARARKMYAPACTVGRPIACVSTITAMSRPSTTAVIAALTPTTTQRCSGSGRRSGKGLGRKKATLWARLRAGQGVGRGKGRGRAGQGVGRARARKGKGTLPCRGAKACYGAPTHILRPRPSPAPTPPHPTPLRLPGPAPTHVPRSRSQAYVDVEDFHVDELGAGLRAVVRPAIVVRALTCPVVRVAHANVAAVVRAVYDAPPRGNGVGVGNTG